MEDKKFKTRITITNSFGVFSSKWILTDEESYQKIINVSKNFYENKGFELYLEDETFMVLPGEITKNSILRIEKKYVEN